MRILLPSVVLGLALPVAAQAASTQHAVTWSATTSSGVVLDGVTMKTVLLGGSTLYGSTPTGPWIGSSAANDAKLTFSAPVKEICVYVWWNNTGEAMTVSTNGTGSDSWRVVDTGGVTSSVDGSGTFTWSAMGDADEALAARAEELRDLAARLKGAEEKAQAADAQKAWFDRSLAALVGTEHGRLELLTRCCLNLLQRQPLLPPNPADPLTDTLAVPLSRVEF